MGARRPPHKREKPIVAPSKPKQSYLVSIEGGAAVLITIITAVVKQMGWELRSALILIGIVVIADLARRIPQRAVMRILIGVVGIVVLLLFSWQSVVEDFRSDPGIMRTFGFKAEEKPQNTHSKLSSAPPQPNQSTDPPCPPGTGICAVGGSNNSFINNECYGIQNCIIERNEKGDTAVGNKSHK